MSVDYRTILRNHLARYPLMQLPDFYKLVHQATMGSEHAVADRARARAWLESELAQLGDGPDEPVLDAIRPDGAVLRVHLRPFSAAGGDAARLLDAFMRTAEEYQGSEASLLDFWEAVVEMAADGETSFDAAEAGRFITDMRESGFPAVHHSQVYRNAYRPAYRVVAARFVSWHPGRPRTTLDSGTALV